MCTAQEFLKEVDGYRSLLAQGNPITISLSSAVSVSVADEEKLLPMLPQLFSTWQRSLPPINHPLPPPTSTSAAFQSTTQPHSTEAPLFYGEQGLLGSTLSRPSTLTRRSTAGPNRVSISDPSSSQLISAQLLESIGAADFPTMRVARLVVDQDEVRSLRLYYQDGAGIPCPGNPSAPNLSPSSRLRIAFGGSISRLVDTKEAIIGSVLRSAQAELPG